MKDEALAYKQELLNATNKVKSATDMKQMASKLTTLEDDFFMGDDLNKPEKKEITTKQEVTLKKSDPATTTDKLEEDKKNV